MWCVCLYISRHLAVQLTCVCCLCNMCEVKYPPWTVDVLVVLRRCNRHCLRTLSIMVLYTFFVKPKWRMVVLLIFTTCSSAAASLRTLAHLGHSMADTPGGGEEIANNGFELLFINTSRDSPPLASFHCYGITLTTFPQWRFDDGLPQ